MLRCFKGKENYEKDFNNDLINRFGSIYEFCNRDIKKLILLLRKAVYPYEYMDSWERFDETSLPRKKDFYRSLNLKDITIIGYRHAKRVFTIFNNKNIGDYHNLYFHSDTLLLADVSEILEVCVLKNINWIQPIFYLD